METSAVEAAVRRDSLLESGHTALLVVDMQVDFLTPGSPLEVRGGLGCLEGCSAAVERARERGFQVVWVVREHHPSGCDAERTRRHLFTEESAYCVPGTPGAELIPPLAGAVDRGVDLWVAKRRFSAFFGTALDVSLRALGVRRVAIAGVQTPNCIRATAFDALSLDYDVSVLRDATASASDDVQLANLNDLERVGCDCPTVHGFFSS